MTMPARRTPSESRYFAKRRRRLRYALSKSLARNGPPIILLKNDRARIHQPHPQTIKRKDQQQLSMNIIHGDVWKGRALTLALLPVMSIFATAQDATAQPAKAPATPTALQSGQEAGVRCLYASVGYAEGSVIQGDGIPDQMCAAVPNQEPNGDRRGGVHAEWVHSSQEIRSRRNEIIAVKAPESYAGMQELAPYCNPSSSSVEPSSSENASTERACGCSGAQDVASGVMVRSNKGSALCKDGRWRPILSCVAYGVEYPEGAVIRDETTESMCAEVLWPLSIQEAASGKQISYAKHLDWIRSTAATREKSAHLNYIVAYFPVCKPQPAKIPGFCGCENFSDFGPKSIMDSPKGMVRCEEGEWRPLPKPPTTP